jgi:hypothetical protein
VILPFRYTAAGGFLKSPLHGYRATILGGERRISFEARCRDSDWPALKPAFERVLTSLAPGSG